MPTAIRNLLRTAACRLRPCPDLPRLAELREHFTRFDQKLALTDYSFAVVDTELTGLNPGVARMVSIGAVRIRGMRIVPGDAFSSLVAPGRELPKGSTLIHRITPEAVASAPHIRSVLPRFVDWLGDSLIVGHHVGLDMRVINAALARLYGAPLNTPCLDTLRLAQAYEEDLFSNYYDQYNLNVSFNLAALAERHGLPRFPAHDALADAMQAAYLFLFLCGKLKGGRVRTLKDLHQAAKPRRFL